MKVRTYIALMATAILVPVSVFSAAALNMLLDAEREAVLRNVRETARAAALAVDRELGDAQAALRVLATSPNLAQGDWPRFYKQAMVANSSKDAWTVLFDRDGQQLVNTRIPFGTPLPKAANPGQMQQVIQAHTPQVTNLLMAPIIGRHTIGIVMPVPQDGGPPYVLAQGLLAEYFNRVFTQRRMPSSWIIGISDREGRTIARSHGAAEFVGKPIRAEVLQATRAATEGELRNTSREGADIYTAFTRSSLSDWVVAVGVPAAEIEAAARRAVIVATLGLLAAFACAAAVAAFFGGRLARSIARAARSAAALGRGEASAAATSGVKEVDDVHSALAEAGAILWREQESRALAEAERAKLFASEQEARKHAEMQNKAKDEFLAMLGHELRNPLSAISGAVSVMEANQADADNIDHARTVIRRQSQHLGCIVDDLLDLSRMSSGKIFIDKQTVDLADAVRACVDALRATGRAEHFGLSLRIQPAWVDADPTRLEQIITNLLVNAFKYTPSGGRIDIDVHVEAEEAVLMVRDSGVGMSSELLPYVFDAFVQGSAPLDRGQGGLGIGLALVRQLATLHGGSVSAQSDGKGKGSMFTVRLPRSNNVAATLPPTTDFATEKNCTVLVVEDNDDGRQMLSMMLRLSGFQVLEASNGTDGLRIAATQNPDVAVIDIGLPGVDGYEVARRLRADPNTQDIKLVALTGYGQGEDKQRALSAGFDIHMVKPVDVDRLIEAIGICPTDT